MVDHEILKYLKEDIFKIYCASKEAIELEVSKHGVSSVINAFKPIEIEELAQL